MDADVLLTLGIITGALSLPRTLAAYAESRRPWVGGTLLVFAAGCVAAAINLQPGGYALDEIPSAVIKVLSGLVN